MAVRARGRPAVNAAHGLAGASSAGMINAFKLIQPMKDKYPAAAPDAPKSPPGRTCGSPHAGVREALETSGANGSVNTVQSFIGAFKRPLEQPLIASPPRLRITKPKYADDDDFVPKRSARLAAKSKYREPKPDAQARKVLMKKLGLEVETEKADEASFEEFQQAMQMLAHVILLNTFRRYSYTMALDDKEIVALSGAHTLGRPRPDRSGCGKPETKYVMCFYGLPASV